MPDGSPLVIGAANTATSTTTLTRSGGGFEPTAFFIENAAGIAIEAGSQGEGMEAIVAAANSGVGVLGVGTTGIAGVSDSNDGAGVSGANSSDGPGVVGSTGADDSAATFGINSSNGPGVWGQNVGTGGWPAVEGFSTNGNGVRGVSIGTLPSSVGVVGFSQNGFGGAFIGGLVVINGPKSAAVAHPDGSHRLLYSLESPESWFEDFGRAKLVKGRAKVKLDAVFAALVRTGDYYVFLSPEGETNGLFVKSRSRVGFAVHENQRGASNASFSYRVVARRKDIEGSRLPKVSLPSLTRADLARTVRTPASVSQALSKRIARMRRRRRRST